MYIPYICQGRGRQEYAFLFFSRAQPLEVARLPLHKFCIQRSTLTKLTTNIAKSLTCSLSGIDYSTKIFLGILTIFLVIFTNIIVIIKNFLVILSHFPQRLADQTRRMCSDNNFPPLVVNFPLCNT